MRLPMHPQTRALGRLPRDTPTRSCSGCCCRSRQRLHLCLSGQPAGPGRGRSAARQAPSPGVAVIAAPPLAVAAQLPRARPHPGPRAPLQQRARAEELEQQQRVPARPAPQASPRAAHVPLRGDLRQQLVVVHAREQLAQRSERRERLLPPRGLHMGAKLDSVVELVHVLVRERLRHVVLILQQHRRSVVASQRGHQRTESPEPVDIVRVSRGVAGLHRTCARVRVCVCVCGCVCVGGRRRSRGCRPTHCPSPTSQLLRDRLLKLQRGRWRWRRCCEVTWRKKGPTPPRS